MRGLTLWQPMAWAIANRHKPVENRPWPLPKGMLAERVAIHAGKRYDEPWAAMIREQMGLRVPEKRAISLGAIVAVAIFADTIVLEDIDTLDLPSLGMDWTDLDTIRTWFSGPYGFLLRDIRPLERPVACRGYQGLWTVPPDVEAEVWARLRPRNIPTSGQIPLLDPVELERRRCLGVVHAKAEGWRKNPDPVASTVTEVLDAILAEIEQTS